MKEICIDREPRILVVDDDITVSSLIESIIRFSGYKCDVVNTLNDAIKLIHERGYDLYFIDLTMCINSDILGSGDPKGKNGIFEEIKGKTPESVVVVVTGIDKNSAVEKTGEKEVYTYIYKPFTVADFQEKLNVAIEEWKKKRYRSCIKRFVEKYLRDKNSKKSSTENAEEYFDMLVTELAANVRVEPYVDDNYTRVSKFAVELGRTMGLSNDILTKIKWGAFLHDIGMVIVPEGILKKPSPLNNDEVKIIKKHPLFGYSMINDLDFLGDASKIVLFHHERYDGNGYPEGRSNGDIPVVARIFAVADAFDAMVSYRPYRVRKSLEEALDIIREQKGKQFDPEVVEVFLRLPFGDTGRWFYYNQKQEVVRDGFAA